MTAADETTEAVGWLPHSAAELFGDGAIATEAYELLTVDVPPERWPDALRTARDDLGCTYFDWLSAVDRADAGFQVCAHVVALGAPPKRLLLRTALPREAPSLPSVTGVYAGAAWHERETFEMFGVDFPGHSGLRQLLLPEGFEGHPLRKDFVLAARVVKAWPGAKEPGEPAGGGGTRRRQMLPPGVPDPNEWGPLKGQLPEAPARRARRASARETPARPPRRGNVTDAPWRTAGAPNGPEARQGGEAPGAAGASPGAQPRRSRSAADGSASQRTASQRSGDQRPAARRGEAGAGASDGAGARPRGDGEGDA